jgi:hypothetical protein
MPKLLLRKVIKMFSWIMNRINRETNYLYKLNDWRIIAETQGWTLNTAKGDGLKRSYLLEKNYVVEKWKQITLSKLKNFYTIKMFIQIDKAGFTFDAYYPVHKKNSKPKCFNQYFPVNEHYHGINATQLRWFEEIAIKEIDNVNMFDFLEKSDYHKIVKQHTLMDDLKRVYGGKAKPSGN